MGYKEAKAKTNTSKLPLHLNQKKKHAGSEGSSMANGSGSDGNGLTTGFKGGVEKALLKHKNHRNH